jgi:uncharacterized metal-binding protein YceD (DUF177 family)
LTPYLREDILLEIPQHPLCEAECCGLPESHRGEAEKPSGPRPAQPQASGWEQLDKLKF